MSTDRETTRIVRSWLRTDEYESADRVLDAVLDQLDTTPQRRATWWPARRLPEMNTFAKFGVAAAAVVVAALLGFNYFISPNIGDPDLEGPSPTPTSAPAEAVQLQSVAGADLEPGLYTLGTGFPVEIAFDLQPGWTSCPDGIDPKEQIICRFPGETTPPAAVYLGFTVIDNVVADPCDDTVLLDPPVGPSVDDLVAAISDLEGFEATAAEDVTVDGFPAKRFTITAGPECGAAWVTPNGAVNGLGADEINDLHVVDINGVRIVIVSAYAVDVDPDELAAVEAVIASLQIEP